MESSILEVFIKNFRAIREARIQLDGITVITGENGAGKSTISRMLYVLFKVQRYYKDFIKEELNDELDNTATYLRQLSNEGHYRDIWHRLRFKIRRRNYSETDFLKLFEYLKVYCLNNPKFIDQSELQRAYYFIHQQVKNKEVHDGSLDDGCHPITLDYFFDKTTALLKDKFLAFNKSVQDRDNIFSKKIRRIYGGMPSHFEVLEKGASVIDQKNNRLGSFMGVDHAFYIDSPMAVDNSLVVSNRFSWYDKKDIDDFGHWHELNDYLKTPNNKGIEDIQDTETYQEMQKLFTSEALLDGRIDLEKDTNELYFRRKDGKRFRLKDCATGVRSIAALQGLYNNGWLNHKTLLILDEPEAHLHPQWVVEYARLIVLLHKKVGVMFLISSHHPDMIAAIQEISDKEKQNKKLKFYLAEKQGDYLYKFINQHLNIENIFDSFNIAMDRINEYGGGDE